MPRFTGRNKKRIDPRYFMDEKLEEAVVGPGMTKGGQWPEDDMQKRASDLAQQAMDKASGEEELPPWESERQYSAPTGDSVTDEDVIRSIYNLLKMNQSSGYRALAGRFMEMMKERGVISQEAGDKIDKGYKIRAARMSGYDAPDGPSTEEIDFQTYGPEGHPYDSGKA